LIHALNLETLTPQEIDFADKIASIPPLNKVLKKKTKSID
jgi:hypothetical protein